MKFLLIAALIVIVIVVIMRGSKRGEEPAHTSPDRRPLANPDAIVIEQLAAAGSDLSQPHDIDYYLYFASEPKAREAAKALIDEGYNAEVRSSNDEGQTLCLAKMKAVPTVETMGVARRKLTRIAETYGGEYDGWECAVVRSQP